MSALLPGGEDLRRAVRWISDRRRDEPDTPVWKLVDEAALRYDLSPPDAEFLLRVLREVQVRDSA